MTIRAAMGDKDNAIEDFLTLRFRDPLAAIEGLDHGDMVLGRAAGEEDDEEGELDAL